MNGWRIARDHDSITVEIDLELEIDMYIFIHVHVVHIYDIVISHPASKIGSK